MDFIKNKMYHYTSKNGNLIDVTYKGEKDGKLIFEGYHGFVLKFTPKQADYKVMPRSMKKNKIGKSKKSKKHDKTPENGNATLGVAQSTTKSKNDSIKKASKIILPNYSGSSYAGTHESNKGIINKK